VLTYVEKDLKFDKAPLVIDNADHLSAVRLFATTELLRMRSGRAAPSGVSSG
jgi:hypothetical protein